MPLMTWTEKLSVGVGVLDEDHKRARGHGKRAVRGHAGGAWPRFPRTHPGWTGALHARTFAREEKLFAQTGYPATAPHKHEHDALTRQVLEVQRKHAAGSATTLSLEVMQFLKNWLINHIQGSDQKYRAHLNANGIR